MSTERTPPPARQNLMQAARFLFFRSGFTAVSVDDICKRAGVHKGSFYHFFDTKEALLVAAMEEDFSQWQERLTTVFNTAVSPQTRLARFAAALVAKQEILHREHGMVLGIPYATIGCETACASAGPCSTSNRMGNIMQAHYTQTLQDAQKAGLIPLTKDLGAMARQLSACVVGALTIARMNNDISSLGADLREMFASLLDGQELPPV